MQARSLTVNERKTLKEAGYDPRFKDVTKMSAIEIAELQENMVDWIIDKVLPGDHGDKSYAELRELATRCYQLTYGVVSETKNS